MPVVAGRFVHRLIDNANDYQFGTYDYREHTREALFFFVFERY